MTGVRLDLANPNTYESPREYVEKHLAPLVTELHRLLNELSLPGASSAEEWGMDMEPSAPALNAYAELDRRLDQSPKHVVFDGSTYESIPKELLRSKQLKVQLSATVYNKGLGDVLFRLTRDDGVIVANSHISSCSRQPETIVRTLPFGNALNCVAPYPHKYIIQGKGLDLGAIPVCRRFSLSFVYI